VTGKTIVSIGDGAGGFALPACAAAAHINPSARVDRKAFINWDDSTPRRAVAAITPATRLKLLGFRHAEYIGSASDSRRIGLRRRRGLRQ
jgi:hypothetical protein